MRIKNESKDWRDVIVLPRSSILFPGIHIILVPSETQDIRLISNLLEMFHFLCWNKIVFNANLVMELARVYVFFKFIYEHDYIFKIKTHTFELI